MHFKRLLMTLQYVVFKCFVTQILVQRYHRPLLTPFPTSHPCINILHLNAAFVTTAEPGCPLVGRWVNTGTITRAVFFSAQKKWAIKSRKDFEERTLNACYRVKEANLKRSIPYDSDYMTFWKGETMKMWRDQRLPGFDGRGTNWWSAEDF